MKMHVSNRYFVTLAAGISFERMMEIAESVFNYEYSNYSDYEEYFYRNLNEHETAYIEPVWRDFLDNLSEEEICDNNQRIEYKGAFFEQVDYTFIFLFNIYLPRTRLIEMIDKLLNLKELQNDDFWVVFNDRQDCFFSPSYSGEDKGQVLAKLGIEQVSWPPLVVEQDSRGNASRRASHLTLTEENGTKS